MQVQEGFDCGLCSGGHAFSANLYVLPAPNWQSFGLGTKTPKRSIWRMKQCAFKGLPITPCSLLLQQSFSSARPLQVRKCALCIAFGWAAAACGRFRFFRKSARAQGIFICATRARVPKLDVDVVFHNFLKSSRSNGMWSVTKMCFQSCWVGPSSCFRFGMGSNGSNWLEFPARGCAEMRAIAGCQTAANTKPTTLDNSSHRNN